ncbi:hypothetical protein AX16_008695 [Volvariella volvacea WC 439]|nr:hypothetical protein AX16_008695 [Volvariella volvacea WC 439]
MDMNNLVGSNWVKAERARIDQEILQLEEQLRDLRLRRNALVPISQLPPEILSRIMTIYQRDIFNEKPPKNEHPSPRSLLWISITQVSSHWRDVALQCPSLWNAISLPAMRHEWAELHFLRSQGTPLSLNVQSPTVKVEHWLRILPSLERSLDRVTSLFIFGNIRTRLGDPLPSLDFSHSPLKTFTAIDCDGWPYRTSGTISGLEHLRLERSYINIHLISRDLVTLVIREPDARTMPTLQAFCGALSFLTKLTHLTLDNVFSHFTETTIDQTRITLPSLVSLTLLNDKETECAHFLSILVSPPNLTHLTVSLSRLPTSLFQLRSILPRFMANTTLPISSSSPALYILDTQGTRRVTIRALNSRNEDVICLSWIRNADLEMPLLANFISQFPFNTPRDLKLINYPPKILQDLSSNSFVLANLDTLTLINCKALSNAIPSCECTRGADVMLSEAEANIRNNPLEPVPLRGCPKCQEFSASIFPNLRTLRFEQTHFSDQTFSLTSLIRFVIHRRDCGRPLTEVVIKCDTVLMKPDFRNRLLRLRKMISIVIYSNGKLYNWEAQE